MFNLEKMKVYIDWGNYFDRGVKLFRLEQPLARYRCTKSKKQRKNRKKVFFFTLK